MANDPSVNNVINMSALGDLLREARERKNLTLYQAQKQTCINSTVLKALEEGNCDSVLNPTYVKSFLKKYSEFLGLDPSHIVNEYKRLHPGTETLNTLKAQASETQSRGASQAVIVIKVIIAFLIGVSLLVFAGGKIAAYIKKHPTQKTTVAAVKAKKPPAPVKASKKSPQKSAGTKKDADMLIPKNVPLKLLLKVNQSVMVKMKTDGNLMFERVLSKGTAEMFLAENVINIYVAKGEAVELILNGKSLGSPGRGLLKNVEITRSGVKIK